MKLLYRILFILRSSSAFFIGVKRPLLLLLLSMSFCLYTLAHAIQPASEEGICGPDTENAKECIESSPPSDNIALPDLEKSPEAAHQPMGKTAPKTRTVAKSEESIPFERNDSERGLSAGKAPAEKKAFVVYFFWGRGCPHCEEEKLFLKEMKEKYPDMKIVDSEVWYNKENAVLLGRMAEAYKMRSSGVPVTFIGADVFLGFSKHSREEIAESIHKCFSLPCVDPADVVSGKISIEKTRRVPITGEAPGKTEELECTEKSKTVYIPWIGNLDAAEMSLPIITLVIAGLDSFNPCAFFVLLSLLGLLIYAQSRRKMLLIGSVFVFFSGFIYFLFMAAWLNLFLVMGEVEIVTKIAGSIAVLIAAVNIKDFFVFKKGVSLTIPDSAKPKLFDRMRKLMRSTSVPSILFGTAVLAIAANAYELLCTAGFPMVFTRILTLNSLTTLSYYFYLILYNLIYVIPLSVIVIVFTVTLGKKHLTEWQGRLMKLISGTMMLGLGGVLLLKPSILSNAFISFLILVGALAVSVVIAFATKKLKYS